MNHLLQYESHNTLWSAFTEGDLPGQVGYLHWTYWFRDKAKGQSGPSASGKTWNGALSCTRTLAANASSTFTFVLSWHFPNRYVNWSQAGFGIPASPTKYFIGNQVTKQRVLTLTLYSMPISGQPLPLCLSTPRPTWHSSRRQQERFETPCSLETFLGR